MVQFLQVWSAHQLRTSPQSATGAKGRTERACGIFSWLNAYRFTTLPLAGESTSVVVLAMALWRVQRCGSEVR